jgi:hypothetical protein
MEPETMGDGEMPDENGSVWSQGFASEASVIAALWDLTDPVSSGADSSGDSTATDEINLSSKDMWSVMTRADCFNIGDFYAILDGLLAPNPREYNQLFYDVFAMNNIAPELKSPADGASLSASSPPTFTWQANGDPDIYECNTYFDLVITSDTYATEYMRVADIQSTSHAPSSGAWQALPTGERLRWYVEGRSAVTPAMPAGQAVFTSNVHTFSVSGGGTDPGDCSIIDESLGYGRWRFDWSYNCDGTLDSNSYWKLYADGSIADHWSGTISGYSWEQVGSTVNFYSDGDLWMWGDVSGDCSQLVNGTTTGGSCWTAEPY